MTTEQLFRDDAYAASCSARIVAAEPNGVVLDRTAFYPLGGGQLGDSGELHLTVPGAVTGGQIADGRGRLDFDLRETAIDKSALERELNDWVARDAPVQMRWISGTELVARPVHQEIES